LKFNGRNRTTLRVPRLANAITVEARVRPQRRGGTVARGRAWRLDLSSVTVGRRTVRGTAPKLGRWTHLAFTYDGRTIRRYVNGRLRGRRAQSGALGGGSVRLGQGFRGRLDELRIYDRALTATEIVSRSTKAE
jgi:hypothetical protein